MKDWKFTVSDVDGSKMAKFVTKFVRNIKVLSKVLKEKCNEVINFKKRLLKISVKNCWSVKKCMDNDVLSKKDEFKRERLGQIKKKRMTSCTG